MDNVYYMGNTYLAHHGIKGMKWGVRRTPAQLGHRIVEKASAANRTRLQRASAASARDAANLRAHGYYSEADAVQRVSDNQARKASGYRKPGMSTAKKVAIGAAVVGGVALAAYGAKTYHDYVRDRNVSYHAQRGREACKAYLDKNTVRNVIRDQNASRQMAYPDGQTQYELAATRQRYANVSNRTQRKIMGYARRQADKDSFLVARKNAKALSSQEKEARKKIEDIRKRQRKYLRSGQGIL